MARKSGIDYIFDPAKRNWISDIRTGQVGSIALMEAAWTDSLHASGETIFDEDGEAIEGDDGKLVYNVLNLAKELSASKGGRGRDDAVEMNRTKKDPDQPADYGRGPRSHDSQPT